MDALQEKLKISEWVITCTTTSSSRKKLLIGKTFCIFEFRLKHILIFSNKKNAFLKSEILKKNPTKKRLRKPQLCSSKKRFYPLHPYVSSTLSLFSGEKYCTTLLASSMSILGTISFIPRVITTGTEQEKDKAFFSRISIIEFLWQFYRKIKIFYHPIPFILHNSADFNFPQEIFKFSFCSIFLLWINNN